MSVGMPTGSAVSVPRSGLGMRFAHRAGSLLRRHRFRGSGRLERLLKKLFIPMPRGLSQVRTLHGFDLLVDPIAGKGLERAVFDTGTYEEGSLTIISGCLRSGDVFIDVGANIGLMSIFAARCVGPAGQVLAFEPEPDVFVLLLRNLDLNKTSNVRAIDLALGSADGSAKIYRDLSVNRGSASLVKPEGLGSEGSFVSVSSLDTFLDRNPVSNVRMLKIDVEGWEHEVLLGARRLLGRHDGPILCIECSTLHPMQGTDLAGLFKTIRDVNDYRVFRLERGKEHPSRQVEVTTVAELPSHDNLFCYLPAHLESLVDHIG